MIIMTRKLNYLVCWEQIRIDKCTQVSNIILNKLSLSLCIAAWIKMECWADYFIIPLHSTSHMALSQANNILN